LPAFTFRDIGHIDVTPILNLLSENDDWNNAYTELRKREYPEIHNNVKTIPLQWSLENLGEPREDSAPKTQFYDRYFDNKFFNELFSKFDEGYPIRIVLAMLKGNSNIASHWDGGDSLLNNQRIHIPIITNEHVLFTVSKTTRNLEVGSITEINNEKSHSVENNSSEDRVHLIIDWHTL